MSVPSVKSDSKDVAPWDATPRITIFHARECLEMRHSLSICDARKYYISRERMPGKRHSLSILYRE